jgi:hypothetical protein
MTRKGIPCPTAPIKGGTRCRMHGGASPNAKRAAKQRLAEAAARRTLDQVGEYAPVDNPLTELGALAGRARTLMEICEGHVAELTSLSKDTVNGEQVRAAIVVYERAIDRTGRLVADLARLNIDERLASISEAQADKVLAAVDALLDHLGVRDPQARMEARAVAGQHLQAV